MSPLRGLLFQFNPIVIARKIFRILLLKWFLESIAQTFQYLLWWWSFFMKCGSGFGKQSTLIWSKLWLKRGWLSWSEISLGFCFLLWVVGFLFFFFFVKYSLHFGKLSGDRSESVGHGRVFFYCIKSLRCFSFYIMILLDYLMVESKIYINNILCQGNKWTLNHVTILLHLFSGISKTLSFSIVKLILAFRSCWKIIN